MARRDLGRLAFAWALAGLGAATSPAHAQAVEVLVLQVERREAIVAVDYALRVTLPTSVEDALRRGVPLHFRVEADLYRSRWYWRDARVGSASRQWRLSFQPLTGTFRVSIGGLFQSFDNLNEALNAMTRMSQWKVADADDVEPGERHYLEFNWRLDTSQLPRPMQIGIGDQPEWKLEVERVIPLARP